MLVSDAYADPPAPTPAATAATATTAATTSTPQAAVPANYEGAGIFGSILPILLVTLVFYFILIRPNQKKIKEYNEMIGSLRRGDRVVTGGGIIGVISKIENDEVLVVEIAPDVKVRIMRETISHVVNKTAVNDNKVEPSKKQDDKASGS